LKYEPGVDGLRALSVGAVFLFHAGVVSGGFIGVDVFFVISGYLITALALAEIDRTDRLALGSFWARRARRLLPAMLLVCAAVLGYSVIEGGGALQRVGRDVGYALLYVANWGQVGQGRDYFALYESPSLLEHAWSLAVEEQFYLVWPIVLVVVLRLAGTQRVRRAVAGVAVAVAAGSVVLATVLASDEGQGLSRLYFGTDTRSVGLAVGATAGAMGLRRAQRSRTADIAGLVSVLGLIAFGVTLRGDERWLYGPGFLMIALLSITVMWAATSEGVLQQVLSNRMLVGVGRVSYGVYLWHWPVIVVLDAERTGLSGIALGALWVVVTALLTAASWFAVERNAPMPKLAAPHRGVGYAIGVGALVVGATVASAAGNQGVDDAPFAIPPAVTTALTSPPVSTESESGGPTPDAEPPTTSRVALSTVSSTDEATTSTVPVTSVATTVPLPDRPLRVQIIGDSVAESLTSQQITEIATARFGQVMVRNDGQIACSMVREGKWWLLDGSQLTDPQDCRGDDRFGAAVEAFEPDVVYLLFGWPGVGGGRELDDGTVITPCEAGFDDRWRFEYQAMIGRFEESATVVFSSVAPPAIDEAERAPGTSCLNAASDELDGNRFDYSNWLCPDGDCDASEGLRSDGIHFRNSTELQEQVLQALLDQVLPVAGY
jgi:peptidoglycan/LPS O-acetylase OafA/YrhL